MEKVEKALEIIEPGVEIISAYDQLRPSEKRFVDAYLLDPVTPAKSGGVAYTTTLSRSVATSDYGSAKILLQRPLVRAAIHERRKAVAEEATINARDILLEIGALAFSTMQDFVDPDSEQIDLSTLSRKAWKQIKSFKVTESFDKDGNQIRKTTQIELHPKLAALTALMDYLKEYAPKLHKAMHDNPDDPGGAYQRLLQEG